MTLKFEPSVFFKGMAMGAADVVPGVSGGTIAFIAGIYERLINGIKSVLPAFLALFKHRQWAEFWRSVDGTFLLTLLSGILTSVALFANLINYLLQTHPIPIWAFFLGLIIASVNLVARHVQQWKASLLVLVVIGFAFGWLITSISPVEIEPTTLNVFLSGMIAICAMILPGISGSFILLVIGMYTVILGAVMTVDLAILSVFALGCVVGLLSIANVLSWAFRHYHDITLAVLTGIMLGSLNKVWPWKEVVAYRQNRDGETVPFLDQNVLPGSYEQLTGNDAQLVFALVCVGLGVVVVLLIEYLGVQKGKQN